MALLMNVGLARLTTTGTINFPAAVDLVCLEFAFWFAYSPIKNYASRKTVIVELGESQSRVLGHMNLRGKMFLVVYIDLFSVFFMPFWYNG